MRSKEIQNRKMYVAFLLVLMLSAFLSVTVQAAWRSYLWAGNAPVKAGGKWFRSENQEMDGEWGTRIEVSAKSKKSGYKTLVEGSGISNGFVTDGKNVYYLQKNTLKVCAVSSKKKTTLKKLPMPTKTSYYTLGGYFNGKIWFVAREQNFIGKAMITDEQWCLYPERAGPQYRKIYDHGKKCASDGLCGRRSLRYHGKMVHLRRIR